MFKIIKNFFKSFFKSIEEFNREKIEKLKEKMTKDKSFIWRVNIVYLVSKWWLAFWNWIISINEAGSISRETNFKWIKTERIHNFYIRVEKDWEFENKFNISI